MAAGDFTASTSLTIQAMMEDAIAGGNQANAEFQRPVVTAQAITTNQTSEIREILQGDVCVGYKVMWQKGTTDAAAYSGAISGDTLNCTITGTQLESDSKTYNVDNHVRTNVAVSTDDCGNDMKANTRRMKALEKAFNNNRVAFNTVAVNFLQAQMQVNQDSGVTGINRGNGAWAVNADTKTIEVRLSDTQDEKALAFVDAVLQNNDISNYFFVHGRSNWYELFHNAAYTRQNDNERSIFATFANRDHYFDLRYLDSTLTGSNTFAVNPASLVFLNKAGYENREAQNISTTDGLWAWSMPDPVWNWRGPDGNIIPVVHTILMTRACTGRDANGLPVFTENYEVTTKYELEYGPAGRNGETGIMKFASVADA